MNRDRLYLTKQPKISLKHRQKPERFVIPDEVIEACPKPEVTATIRDMELLGVAKLPYRDLVLDVPAATWYSYLLTDPEYLNTIKGNIQEHFADATNKRVLHIPMSVLRQEMTKIPKDKDWSTRIHIQNNEWIKFEYFGTGFQQFYPRTPENTDYIGGYLDLLIVLLATKNVRKERVHNKLAKLGIGKNRFEYTTTLRLPVEFSEGRTRDGVAIRPHLRRGHKRDQWFPKAQVHKAIWIEPCFVNADEDFVSARTSYSIRRN